jgi:hypothetical protein
LVQYTGSKDIWFDEWHLLLDGAVESLPLLDACPHELFRLMVKNPESAGKKIALVTEQGTPVAVFGLRQKGRFS